MKRSLRLLVVLFATLIFRVATAQTLYWDTNGPTAGSSAGTTAPGTWGLGSNNWSTSSDGTIATQAWSNGANAVFSAGTNATGAYTVSVFGGQTAGKITFAHGDVTVSDSTLIVPAIEVAADASANISSNLDFDSFTKSDAGLLTLSGTVTATGYPSSLFNVTAGDVVLSGSMSPLFDFASLTFSGAAGTGFTIANGGAVITDGLELTDQLAFIVAAGGTLSSNGNLSVSSGTPTFNLAGGKLVTNTANLTSVTPQVNLVASTTSEIETGTNTTLALNGGVSGAGAMNKTGGGTLALYGDNTGFSGGATLTAGTLVVGHANALGSDPLTFAGGNLLVQGVSPTVTPFVMQNGSATVTGGGVAGTTLASDTYVEIGNGGTGVLTIAGKGKVDAATSVVAGIGTGGNGTINVDGADSLLEVGTFFVAGYASGTTGTLALTNNGSATVGQYALIGNEGSGTLSVASGASFTTTQDLNLGYGANGTGILNVSGGSVTTGLNAYIGYAGTSTATVSGTNSAWNVAETLYTGFGAAGTLTIGDGGSVTANYVDLAHNAGSTGTINVNAGGTLSLGGLTRGSGTATLNLAGGTLGIINRTFTTSVPLALADNTTSTLSISGLAVQFDGGISGNGALAKDGAGIVTLNAANTYSGGTVVNDGTLALTNASALGSTSAPLTLNGGTLDLGGFNPTTGTVVFNGGTFANGTLVNASAFEVRTGSLSAALSGSAALTKTGAGSFVLAGANTYTGDTTVEEGTLVLGNSAAIRGTFAGGAGTLSFGTLTAATFGDLSGSSNLALTNASGQAVALTVGANNPSVTYSGGLSGLGSLLKQGGGTFFLTGNNTYSGATTVHLGTVELTGSSARISGTAGLTIIESGSLHVANGAQFTTSGQSVLGDATLNTGVTGSVTVSGSGSRLEIGGALTVGNISNGTVTVNNGGVIAIGSHLLLGVPSTTTLDIGAGTLNIATGGTLQLGGADGLRRGSVPDPFYPFLSPNPTRDGFARVNLSGGMLQVSGSTLTSSVPMLLTQTSTIDTNGFNATLSGLLFDGTTDSGYSAGRSTDPDLEYAIHNQVAGSLTKVGAGTLTLSAANTYSGATTISAGTLALGAGGSLASLSIHIASGATFDTSAAGGFTLASGRTLTGSGTVVGNLAIASGGTFSPGSSPGLFTVNGDLSLLGTTLMELAAAGTRGSAYDAITATGAIAFGGTLTVSLLDGFSPTTGMSFDLFDWTGASTGAFSAVNLPALGAGLEWNTAALYSNGLLSVATSAVPEPSTYAAIFGAAALALAAWHRRRFGVR